MLPSIIAIGGPHGSGKSSVAKKISEELQMDYVSAGEVFRSIAVERNVTLEVLSKTAKTEPEIDRLIDDRTKELAYGATTNTIVDAQLAAHFTPKHTKLRIYITASLAVRNQRIASREGWSIEKATQETKIREEAERQRFFDLYAINVDDSSVYDVIVNTDRLDYDQTYNLCLSLVKSVL